MALEEGITGQMNGEFFTHQYRYSLKNISAAARRPGSTWVNFTELTCVVQLACSEQLVIRRDKIAVI